MKVTVEECETIPGEWNVRVDERLVSWGKDERDAGEVADAISRELAIVAIDQKTLDEATPVPMILHCPDCRARHVDAGEFATKPHHTHACQSCGLVWRPAIVPTVGVQFLPGYQNARPKLEDPSRSPSAGEDL